MIQYYCDECGLSLNLESCITVLGEVNYHFCCNKCVGNYHINEYNKELDEKIKASEEIREE